jgi:hypothetical protein
MYIEAMKAWSQHDGNRTFLSEVNSLKKYFWRSKKAIYILILKAFIDFTFRVIEEENHMKLLQRSLWTRRFDSEYVYCYFEKLSG